MDLVIRMWKDDFEKNEMRMGVREKNSAKRGAWKAQMKEDYGKVQLAITFIRKPLCLLTVKEVAEA